MLRWEPPALSKTKHRQGSAFPQFSSNIANSPDCTHPHGLRRHLTNGVKEYPSVPTIWLGSCSVAMVD